MNMACTLFRMTPREALLGVTRMRPGRSERADGHGILAAGRHADFCVWDVESLSELAYWCGFNPCDLVVRRGEVARKPAPRSGMSGALFAANAWIPEGWRENVLLAWDANGRLNRVESGATPPAGVSIAQGSGDPGMPNLHCHAFQRAMAGLTEYRGASQDSFLDLARFDVRVRAKTHARFDVFNRASAFTWKC